MKQIAKEGFLEFINNILTVGVVPALFSDDEKDVIVGQCRNAANEAGFSVGRLVINSKHFVFHKGLVYQLH